MVRLLTVCVLILSFSCANAQAKRQFQFSQLDITNGLSNNQVTTIFKDSEGFMWIGTLAGLNRYDGARFKIFKHSTKDKNSINDDFIERIDEGPQKKLWVLTRHGYNIYNPETESFDRNINSFLRKIGITSQNLIAVKKGKDGDFWFITSDEGIYRYRPTIKKIEHLYHKEKIDNKSLSSNNITDLVENSSGNFWAISANGTIDLIDAKTNKVVFSNKYLSESTIDKLNYSLSVDRDNDLWIFSPQGDIGLYLYDHKKNSFNHFGEKSDKARLNSDIINGVVQDNKGSIWIATDHGGINLLNKSDFSVRYLMNREDDKKSISQNSVVSIYKDNSDIVWIGTFKKGLSFYNENIIKFPLIRNYVSSKQSLIYDDVNRFVEDDKGNLWIGTNGGGLIYFDRTKNTFTQFRHQPGNSNSLSNDIIVSLWIDHKKKLWIGSYFGGLDCFYDGKFTNYKHDNANPNSLSDDRVWEIFEDSDYNLWVGTLRGGINRFDQKTKIFYHFKIGPNSVHSLYTSAIVEDKQGNIWLGTSDGIDIYIKKTKQFIHYSHRENDPQSLIHDNVKNILIDSRGLIWISTAQGMSMFNPKTQKFRNFQKEDGLPDNVTIDILEDNEHNLWISTSNGISNLIINPKKGGDYNFIFKNYDDADGLQGAEFNESSSLKTRRGELIFGGPNGFNIFKPQDIRTDRSIPVLVLSDLQIANKIIGIQESVNGQLVLEKALNTTSNIELNYKNNAFSIEFNALNYFNHDKIKYKYILEGFDKKWQEPIDNIRRATYTNVNPGHYTFKVLSTNSAGQWVKNEKSIEIEILPPWYLTWTAYICYILLFGGGLYAIRLKGIRNLKKEFLLEQEREQAQRIHELDMMKIKFFTNVSHEFRTPLSLIISPLDKLINQTSDESKKAQMQMIQRNSKRLLNMVNQLLDFRRLEVKELKLQPTYTDIVSFVRDLAYSFSDIADKKNIKLEFITDLQELIISFDNDKIERIMFNLLSNAFKFTLEGGHVSIDLTINTINNKYENLILEVADNGIGIELEKQEIIFERFFQNDVPGSVINQGSGIGLAITKEFVKLHGGDITVTSSINQGSAFKVSIPIKRRKKENTSEEIVQNNFIDEVLQESTEDITLNSSLKAKILLVEDNDDFRFYLKDNLKEFFQVIEASNGKIGWQKALGQHPSLIVSDVTMPEMDGITLCKKIKLDSRTSHIPVILLTALTGDEQQLMGLETGATDYMTKPFNFEILLSKIRNTLQQQDSMKKTYQKQVEVNPTEVVGESSDETFIRKALDVVENNIANLNFSVEELSYEMNMSRVTLYKKVLAVTGKTPVEFIRVVRVKRAAQLLETESFTISQVADKVGFKSQKYFVKVFKEEFNMIPSTYIVWIKSQDK